MKLTQLTEQKERPYICVHADKGKHETHAVSSYDAAKNAAKHWKLKSTAGVTPMLADVEHVAEKSHQVESYDDYHGDMSKEEYDKTVKGSEMEYSVWVGGTEVNDNYLAYDEAVRLYDKYKAQGYDDVQLDARIKEITASRLSKAISKPSKIYLFSININSLSESIVRSF